MNQADILKLAAAAGFECSVGNRKIVTVWAINQCRFDGNCDANVTQELHRFAELVAQHEREACADIVDNWDTPDCGGWNASGISEAIRARNKS